MDKTLHLEVVTPERSTLSRDVTAVRLPGEEGSLGVLPGHAHLVVALKPGLLTFHADGAEVDYAVGGGYAEITPSRVIVLADTAEPAEDIDEAAARQTRRQALLQLRQGVTGAAAEAAEVALHKALAELRVADLQRRRKMPR